MHGGHSGHCDWSIFRRFAKRSVGGVNLIRGHHQLRGPGRQQSEGRAQFETVLEKSDSAENVKAQSGARHGHDQPTHVANVPHRFGSDQRKQDEVVLLTLETINRCYLNTSQN